MSVITFNNVKHSIMAALKNNFLNTTIYGETVEQGFKEPCFFIKSLNPSEQQILNKRYYRTHSFDIHYFPSTVYKNEEIDDVADGLYNILEYLPIETELLRGSKMNHETIDGVLHFFVNYDLHVYKEPAVAEPMTVLTVDSGIKE